ncbi:MAG: pilus assembly protein N-terminal domain-containing protein [Deltaproteobacteria bacterium]|nr:pilus assembly protein N-terminal domain-containing protein [Deltaproteobacteria bacterium]
MKASILTAVAVVLMGTFVWGPARAQSDERIIRMVVGEQQKMKFKGTTRVSVGNQRVADAKPLGGDAFLLFAVGPGRTTLMVMRQGRSTLTFTVVVHKEDVKGLMAEVKKLLGDREGITIRPIGDRVVLDGLAFTSEDYNRVEEICKLYPSVKSFVKVNPNAKKLVANQLNVAFKSAGLKNVEATVVGTKIFLEGSVESKMDLQKAQMITNAIGEQVENLLTVGIKRMVLVEVDFVEISKQGQDHIGVKWPLDISGSATVSSSYSKSFIGGGEEALDFGASIGGETKFALGMLFTDGYARVLAQPKLVCASGEKAEFMSGGEVPIPMITSMAVKVEYKQFGIIMRIVPTADRHGNIQMTIYVEVSDIDKSLGVTAAGVDFPGFSKSLADTNVTVRHGQTIVLSGLFHHNEGKDLSKVPLLGHIPIIGELFKSRTFREKKSELCVFVTPRIVNPETPKILKMISDIKSRYKRAKDEVGFGIFD